MRIKPYEAIPLTKFGTAILEEYDGREARVIWLQLPIFGYEAVDYGRRYAWCQRMLIYHGHHGFSLRWFPVSELDKHAKS